jgi:mitochondrial fission protein ELM1
MKQEKVLQVSLFLDPRFATLSVLALVLYILGGTTAQFFAEHTAWQKWPPIVVFAAVAVLCASAMCFMNARLTLQGKLAKLSWGALGASFAAQGIYEWMEMRQIVGDEDGIVVGLCLVSAISTYLLVQLENLSSRAKSVWVLGLLVQGLATITDAGDGGLSIAGGAPVESLGWIADFLDLVWAPAYAIILGALTFELARQENDYGPDDGARHIWILTNGRLGDFKQMRALATSLGWPTEIKRIILNTGLRLDIPELAPFLFNRERSDALQRPWPDLVITAEAPLAPIARWIKARSEGKSRTVHIGRPAGPPPGLDLVVTSPQFSLADAANVLRLPLPLSADQHLPLTDAEQAAARRLDRYPRPLVGVLIGGSSPPCRFGPPEAIELAQRCENLNRVLGGSIVAITSPRSGSAIEGSFRLSETTSGGVYRWSEADENSNPYRALLQMADCFVVTSDSVSMLSEAIATSKPVYVHDLPVEQNFATAMVAALGRIQTANSPYRFFNPVYWLFRLGILYVLADKLELIRSLRVSGLVHDWPKLEPDRPMNLVEVSRAAVQRLFSDQV